MLETPKIPEPLLTGLKRINARLVLDSETRTPEQLDTFSSSVIL
jgi:hypothetical protein